MAKYRNENLRWDILVTLAYIPFSSFRVRAILLALRPTGYDDLTETSLMAQIKYLEEGGYIAAKDSRNIITEEEVVLVTITKKGIDLLEKNIKDVGVRCGA